MIFVIGKALVNLGFGQIWQTIAYNAVNRLAILKQTNDIVHSNARAFHTSTTPANAGRTRYIAIFFCDRCHS